MSLRIIATTGLVATLITAGCASGSGPHGGAPSSGPTSRPDSAGAGTLAVTIAMYGGPMRPDGHMALNGSPATGQPVKVRDAHGRTWPGNTGASGTAVFTVPAGTYRVSSSYCGIPTSVTLAAGTARPVALQCDVP